MALSSGARLGPYEIVSAIGAGGMGEVYRARDTKLNRDVAIKILPDLMALDADRRARFEREAQVLASLNHPHIAQIHGFEDSTSTCGLVMELVDGPTLADRIAQGPIPIEEALSIARQIADALEAAHERGVIHRDLKPANIKLTSAGSVKILDFGLAKALGPADGGSLSGSGSLSLSPTFTNPGTQMGVILGTAAYMSPEQARGTPVDKRADIWAFGVVLYEMVTGRRLFDGDTVSDTLAAVLKSDPEWSRVPARVRPLIACCLEREPKKRLRDIGDAWHLLAASHAAAPSVSRGRSWMAWAAAAVFLVAAAVLLVLRFTDRPPAPSVTRFQIPAPVKTIFDIYLALSPDGRRLAFTARDASGALHLWVRDMETLEARVLAGTENVGSPFWSPDSRFIGFGVDRQLKKIDVAGGPPQTLCTVPFIVGLGSWNRDGTIIFGARGNAGIHRISSAGGQPSEITVVDPSRQEAFHSLPAFLPDGRHFIYLRQSVNADHQGIYIGSLDVAPAAQRTDRLVPGQYAAAFAPAEEGLGYILFLRDGTLVAQSFDTRALTIQGEAIPLVEDVGRIGSYGTFTASATGTLAFRQGDAGAVTSSALTWLDRAGTRLGVVGPPGPNLSVDLSPDGSRAAIVRGSTSVEADIWVLDLARGVTSRFTFPASREDAPVWSPDGLRIAFRSNRERAGNFDLYEKMSNGTAEEVPIRKSLESERPSDWSRDGRFIAYDTGPSSVPDIYVMPLEGDRTPIPIVETPASDSQPRFSPDGRWIAYVSNESGRSEVYVRSWSPPGIKVEVAAGKWQVSRDGGNTARWRRDGRELFFRALDGSMMAVDVASGAAFESGTPRKLFDLPQIVNVSGWDVSPDGKRFIVTMPTQAAASAPITVVLNWQQGLRR